MAAGAAAAERMRVKSTGDFQFNSGYGSAATAYGCRAWISYAGVGAFIRGSGNVSSVTINGTGDYTVNFTTALVDANYAANVTCNFDDAGGMTDGAVGNAVAGSCRIICHDIAGGTKYNPYSIYLSVFR
jgi:hypothetical protein